MDKMLILRKAASANPDLQFMDETKLRERIGALSLILLQPSCYRAFVTRHVNLALRDNKNIPAEPPAEASSSAPFHPLVRHVVLRHPEILRRRDFQEAVDQLAILFPNHDVLEIIGRYPPILTLDLTNRVKQKLFYLTNIFENPDHVTALLAAQPDILHVKTEMLAPRRMDALADYLGLSNDQVLAFVRDFPRFISPTLPARDVQRLAVFRMAAPSLQVDPAAAQRLKRDANAARDLASKLGALTAAPSGETTGAWRDHFPTPRALLKAVKMVVLAKDSVFRELFPAFAAARRGAHAQREQRAGQRAQAGHPQLRGVPEVDMELHTLAPKEDFDVADALRGRTIMEAEVEALDGDESLSEGEGGFSERVRGAVEMEERADERARQAELAAMSRGNREGMADEVYAEVWEARMKQDLDDVFRPNPELELGEMEPSRATQTVKVERKVRPGMEPVAHEEPQDVSGMSVHENRAGLRVVERDAARHKLHAYRGPATNTPVEEDHGEMRLADAEAERLRLERKHQGREMPANAEDALEAEEEARARRAMRKKERAARSGASRRDTVEQSWYGSEPHGPK